MSKEIVMYGNRVVEDKIEKFITDRLSRFVLGKSIDRRVIINKMIRGCRNCSLFYETQFNPIPPIINRGCFAVFVGRSPGKTEALRNELYPKGTPVGALFDNYLTILGLSRSEVSVLNMVNCYTLNNRPPQQECINKCVAYKKFELELIGDSYQIVFMMGNDACRWVFGKNSPGVLYVLGEVYKAKVKGREVVFVPIIHPSHLLIQPEYKESAYKVLVAVRGIINNIKMKGGVSYESSGRSER